MQIHFNSIITFTRSSCKKCVALVYEVPCEVSKTLAKHLTNFGKPVYDLDTTALLKIKTDDDHTIETRIGRTYIKFGMPKSLEGTKLDETTRKLEFEESIRKWIEEALQIKITKG